VTYPILDVQDAQEQEALDLLKDVAARCLQVKPDERMEAWEVQSELFQFMTAHQWTNCLTADWRPCLSLSKFCL